MVRVVVGGFLLFAAVGLNAGSQAAAGAPRAADSIAEVVDAYCIRCHSERLKRGDLDLESLDVEQVEGGRRQFTAVPTRLTPRTLNVRLRFDF